MIRVHRGIASDGCRSCSTEGASWEEEKEGQRTAAEASQDYEYAFEGGNRSVEGLRCTWEVTLPRTAGSTIILYCIIHIITIYLPSPMPPS